MSTRALSGEQFHDKLIDPEGWGGYSVRPHTGDEPTSGHMVSRWGHEKVEEGVASGEQIDAYLDEHDEHFRENKRMYHGAWVESDKTYLDESKNLPTRQEAVKYGRANAQIAAYDVAKGKAYTIPADPKMKIKGTLFEGLSKTERNKLGATNRETQRLRRARELEIGATSGGRVLPRTKSRGEQLGLFNESS